MRGFSDSVRIMDADGFTTKVLVREDDNHDLFQALLGVRPRMRAKRLTALAKLGVKVEQGLLVPIESLQDSLQRLEATELVSESDLHTTNLPADPKRHAPEAVDAEALGDIVDLLAGAVVNDS